MPTDREILRALAHEYAEAAGHPRNAENAKLYRAVNGLRMIRPVVLINEEPWCELNTGGELTLYCTDPDFRRAEQHMRRMLYKWRHYPCDMIVPPYIPVDKIIGGESGWLSVIEDTIETGDGNNIKSHEYTDQLANPEDIDKLKMPKFTYEEKATLAIQQKLDEAVGDIIPIRLIGQGAYITPWDKISTYRGVTNLLIDLVDRPEHSHAIMEKMTRMFIEQYRQFEELGLLDRDPLILHCTAGLCDELVTEPDQPVLRKNVWGRGTAQIFASVSKEMHEEFEIEYEKRLMEPFGLVYYGCCEPLDKKIDIVKKIPRLRKISITPWANADIAAEAIGKDYVVALKPNPANVGAAFDREVIRNEVKHLLDACARNNCTCELTLKDISTVAHNPNHLEIWEQTVMELVRAY